MIKLGKYGIGVMLVSVINNTCIAIQITFWIHAVKYIPVIATVMALYTFR
jgi:hypothetical protein